MLSLARIEPYSFFTQAYSDYAKELNAYAYARTHNSAMCQDLVQEAFIKTWQYLLRRGEIAAMRPFLYRVLNNLIIDEYRRRKTLSLDLLLEKGYEPSLDPSERLANLLDGTMGLALIRRLPEPYASVVHLRYVHGLTSKEIARATHQTRNAVGVQLHRGLLKLRELYLRTSHESLVRSPLGATARAC
jgi:RNA polymerase sigma-70 factor (ECF subfamily)